MEFSHLGRLKRHTDREHLKRFPFSCEVSGCGKSFSSRHEVKLHNIHAHSDARPFPCDVCNTAYKINGKLMEHQRSKSHLLKVEESLKKSSTSKMKNSIKAYFMKTTATQK
ncbi:Zinc finger X-linked protein ZXDB [Folsomia candida]|uniref:Zinc finger X-linked protein ZXDB n=1 Tax=Folsomia candida TaxID=158441 RepID=A0A226F432_FOLCA|nr:Zinc finger X-linked protein ZXDB [Folsomia candida]